MPSIPCMKISDELAVKRIYRTHDLNLQNLADAVDSKPHLVSQVINQKMGKNFYDLINRYRITEAKQRLIEDPNAKVFDIAVDVGYSTKSSFNAAFKRYTDESPSSYRQRFARPSK